MKKEFTCIRCPAGCRLTAGTENGRVTGVTGNKCDKGVAYARQEIEDPRRIVTSTVRSEGLVISMVPVRTSAPVPKSRVFEVMEEIRKLKIGKPVMTGETLVKDFLGLGTGLIATRSVEALPDKKEKG